MVNDGDLIYQTTHIKKKAKKKKWKRLKKMQFGNIKKIYFLGKYLYYFLILCTVSAFNPLQFSAHIVNLTGEQKFVPEVDTFIYSISKNPQ